ncbi:MAG: hypothetical protein JW881_08555 [Spirochaetales bacterium]|nr:hypothetical protein [Spirochaetales bacterium]
MNDKLSIITYNGQKIIFLDLTNLKEEHILATHPDLVEFSVKNNIRLLLIDTTNTITTPKVKESSANTTNRIEEKIGKTLIAIIGLRGIQKLIANAIVKGIYFAKDKDDGCEWLVKNSGNLS